MHTLYLLRHAKSSWADLTLPDEERPLAPRGRRDAARLRAHLRRHAIEPELVLCSSALRTRETLELLRRALPAAAQVSTEPELYAAPAGALLERLRAVPEDVASVLLVGHNPGISQLATRLVGGSHGLPARIELPPAGLLSATWRQSEWQTLRPDDATAAQLILP